MPWIAPLLYDSDPFIVRQRPRLRRGRPRSRTRTTSLSYDNDPALVVEATLSYYKGGAQYNDSLDARTTLIGSLLEPVLIIGLGILVGFILVAMYLPLFQMSTSVG